MDGYSLVEQSEKISTRLKVIKQLASQRIEINDELHQIAKKLENLGYFPKNLDNWIESMPSADGKDFRLQDLKKMFSLNKQYNKLVEKQETNNREIKIIVIDNLLDKIKNLIEKP